MLFSEIIGQESVKNQLRHNVAEGRISHAQIFLGPEGSGSLPMALAYSQYISCENRSDIDSCGVCPSCVKYAKLIHPDLHMVYPVVKKETRPPVSEDFIGEWRTAVIENPYMNLNMWIGRITTENKQGGIFEAESGEILRKISLKSFESDYKTMIIWMPEKMNSSCANKLLKILEEPPEKTLFILVAEDTSTLLTTILSRCQLIKIPLLQEEDIKAALQKLNVAEPDLSSYTHLSNGNYLKAMSLIGQADFDRSHFESFTKWMRMCYAQRVPDMLDWVDTTAALGREGQKEFLIFSLRMVRENFMLTSGASDIAYLTGEENAFSAKFHPYINERNVAGIAEELSKAHYHIESNANAKILFLDLSLKITRLLHQ